MKRTILAAALLLVACGTDVDSGAPAPGDPGWVPDQPTAPTVSGAVTHAFSAAHLELCSRYGRGLLAHDFDGDGCAEVVIATEAGLSVALGTGDGPGASVPYLVGASGQLEEDLGPVLMATRPGESGDDLLLADGLGTVARIPWGKEGPHLPRTVLSGRIYTESTTNIIFEPRLPADLDGDGQTDLVAVQKPRYGDNADSGFVAIWWGGADFDGPHLYSVPGYAGCAMAPWNSAGIWVFAPLAQFDWNQDGAADLLCANGTVLSFGDNGVQATELGFEAAGLAELTGAPPLEIVSVAIPTVRVRSLAGDTPELLATVDCPDCAGGRQPYALDLDGDGIDELLLQAQLGLQVFRYEDGALTPAGRFLYPEGSSTSAHAEVAGPVRWGDDTQSHLAAVVQGEVVLYDLLVPDDDVPPHLQTQLFLKQCRVADLDGDGANDLLGRWAQDGAFHKVIGYVPSAASLGTDALELLPADFSDQEPILPFRMTDEVPAAILAGRSLVLMDQGHLPAYGLATDPDLYWAEEPQAAIALLDADQDGHDDVVYGDGQWRALPAPDDLLYEPLQTDAAGCLPGVGSLLVPAGDGSTLLVTPAEGGVDIHRSTAGGSCQEAGFVPLDGTVTQLVAGDSQSAYCLSTITGVAVPGHGALWRFDLGDGGSGEPERVATVPCPPLGFAPHDLNGDGVVEFAVTCGLGEYVLDDQDPAADWPGTTIRIVSQFSSVEPFSGPVLQVPLPDPTHLQWADLNGDGLHDLVVAGSGAFAWWLQEDE